MGMIRDVVVNEAGKEKREMEEIYVLMVGYPGHFKDPEGSDLVFPYVYGAALAAFHSLDDLVKFLTSLISVSFDYMNGIPFDKSSSVHGVSEEEVKRIIAISGFLRIVDPSQRYFVLRFSRGKCSIIDTSELGFPNTLTPKTARA